MRGALRAALCAALLLCCLAGCGASAVEEPAFFVEIVNDSGAAIHEVRYEYGLASEPLGGGGVRALGGRDALVQGESLRIDFTAKDFPDGTGDFKGFWIKLSVLLEEGGEPLEASPRLELSPEFGAVSAYALTERDGALRADPAKRGAPA